MVLLGFLLLWVVLLFPLFFCVVLPFFPLVGLRSPSLLLGGAAWFSFSGWCCHFFCPFGGTTFPLSSVGLVHASLGCCCVLLCLLLLWTVLLFQSPFRWSCLPSPPFGGALHHLLWWSCFFPSSEGWCCLVVLLFTSPLSWCCLPSPPLGVVLLSFPSSVGWCCLLHSILVVLRSPSLQLGPAFLSPPPLGGVAFPISFQVVLPSFSSSGWGCFPLLFGWVVLLGFFLLWVVLMFFFTCLVVLPSFPSSVLFCWVVLLGLLLLWVAIPLSIGVELPYFRSFGCWLRSPSLLLRGVAFLPFLWRVVLFSPLRLGGAAWSPPPLGGVAFPLSFCVLVPSCPSSWWDYFSPRLLLGGAAWSTRAVLRCFFFAWCCLSSPPFGGAAFPRLLLGGAAGFSPVGWCCCFSFSFSWCCLPFPPLGGVAFFTCHLLGGVAVQNQKEKMQRKEKFENSGKVEK